MLTKLTFSCLLVAVIASSVCRAADDDLKTLVKNAVDAEVKILDGYRERHDKNKLTKDEQLKFFGKNYSRTPSSHPPASSAWR